MATQHRHEREPAFAGRHPAMVWRLARSLGGKHARRRRDELQPENRLSGCARETAFDRTLDEDRPNLPRIRGDHRRSDGVDSSLDGPPGVHQAERPGEPDLLRAALPGRKLWPPGALARRALRGP